MAFNFEEDIPIIVEREAYRDVNKEISSESFIDKIYEELQIKSKSNDENQVKVGNSVNKRNDEGMAEDKSSYKDSYYEKELIKCYKERILFLESQVNRLNLILENYIHKSTDAISQNQSQLREMEIQTHPPKHSIAPDFFDASTPNISVTEKHL